MDLLKDLNPQQVKAVTVGSGPVLVLAGPGSGKTRVLTHRMAYLIGAMGVRPYSILAVTFTNKAAREIDKRVRNLIPHDLQGIMMGTFHSVCARILRREAEYLPINANYVIYDDDDQSSVVKRSIRELNIDEKIYKPSNILNAISLLKNDMILPENVPVKGYKDSVVQKVYERYQQVLVSNNAVDFDDLLIYTARLLEEKMEVRERYSRRFEHILVDEFQDTNIAQYTLLRYLAYVNKNIYVVGDEDQSIYRWRGADYHNVERFVSDFPGTTKILLEQNYRSTQTVLNAARAVIDRNRHRTPKKLFTERGTGDKIKLFVARDDRQEAEYITQKIAELINSRRFKSSDCAIMYRTNAQSRLLEEAFIKAGMPYRLVGAQRFYGRREVKDVIAYLRLVHNPADEVSLARVINVPQRQIGDKTLQGLMDYAHQIGISAGIVLMDLPKGTDSPHWNSLPKGGVNRLADFGSRMLDWLELKQTATISELLQKILNDIEYRTYIEDESEEGQDRWGNVEEVLRLAFEFEERGLDAFLESLALVGDQDTLPDVPDAVTMLTLHAAKGLEFGAVFIFGVDEKVLPHSRSLDDEEELQEERRLFYVGMTRAKDQLYLSRAEFRGGYGGMDITEPSRFLADIPKDLLKIEAQSPRSYSYSRNADNDYGSRSEQSSAYLWKSSSTPVKQPELRYKANMRVSHSNWGEGWVLESKIMDGDEVVDVSFDSVGLKRLLAALAGLTVIEKK
jgi:DNA helicase II / ATP-dependent DNA helicase PcrA